MKKKEAISQDLLDILVCPVCHNRLTPVLNTSTGEGLRCGKCRLVYPVREGIPVMLVDEARKNGHS